MGNIAQLISLPHVALATAIANLSETVERGIIIMQVTTSFLRKLMSCIAFFSNHTDQLNFLHRVIPHEHETVNQNYCVN
jgi:hypothetical protein